MSYKCNGIIVHTRDMLLLSQQVFHPKCTHLGSSKLPRYPSAVGWPLLALAALMSAMDAPQTVTASKMKRIAKPIWFMLRSDPSVGIEGLIHRRALKGCEVGLLKGDLRVKSLLRRRLEF